MKKDLDLINEAYHENIAQIDEYAQAVAAAGRALAPAAKAGVQQGVATGVSNRISGSNEAPAAPQQLNASANKMKQMDSLDSSNSADKKVADSLRENYRKMIEDGVAHMVESNCDDKSPLSFREGYEHVRELADNKLRDLDGLRD